MVHTKAVKASRAAEGKTVIVSIRVAENKETTVIGKIEYYNDYYERLKDAEDISVKNPYNKPCLIIKQAIGSLPTYINLEKVSSIVEINSSFRCYHCGDKLTSFNGVISDSKGLICPDCRERLGNKPKTYCSSCGEEGFSLENGVYDMCPECLKGYFVCHECESLEKPESKHTLKSTLVNKDIFICDKCFKEATTSCNSCGGEVLVTMHNPKDYNIVNKERIVCVKCSESYSMCPACNSYHDEFVKISNTEKICITCFTSRNGREVKFKIKEMSEASVSSSKEVNTAVMAYMDKPVIKKGTGFLTNTGAITHYQIKSLIADLGVQTNPIYFFGISNFNLKKLGITSPPHFKCSCDIYNALAEFIGNNPSKYSLPELKHPILHEIVGGNKKGSMGICFDLRKKHYPELVAFLKDFQNHYTQRVASGIIYG